MQGAVDHEGKKAPARPSLIALAPFTCRCLSAVERKRDLTMAKSYAEARGEFANLAFDHKYRLLTPRSSP